MQATLRYMVALYLLLLGLSWIADDEIKAYIASIGLLLIPVTIGFSVQLIADRFRYFRRGYLFNVRSALKWWMIGAIALTILCSIFSLVSNLAFIAGIILSSICIVICMTFGGSVKSSWSTVSRRTILSVCLVMIGTGLAYWYLRRLSVFPLVLGSDFWDHLAAIAQVSAGARGVFLYDDAFIVLLEVASSLAGAKPLWMFWSAPLIQYTVMAMGTYMLSRRFLRNYYTPILAAIVPVWFMSDGMMNDLIFFLRRNVLMSMIPLFIWYLFLQDDDRDEAGEPDKIQSPKDNNEIEKTEIINAVTKPEIDKRQTECAQPARSGVGLPFLCAGILPAFYYFGVSNSFYISTIHNLPYIIQVLFQPGFLFTSPAMTFEMPLAASQSLYVIAIVFLILYLLIRVSRPTERGVITSWATVSIVAIMINYRMGVLLSSILFVFLLLKYRAPSLLRSLSLLSLGLIGLSAAGLHSTIETWFASVESFISESVFQVGSVAPLPFSEKISFLSNTYGQIPLYLVFFSILVLSLEGKKKRKSTAIIVGITASSLALYFLPFPNPERFLFLVTPFAVLLILISFETLLENPREIVVAARVRSQSVLPRKLVSRVNLIISKDRLVKAIAMASLVSIVVVSLTGPYDQSIQNWVSMYSPTGSVSSFDENDIAMADWLRQSMPSTTVIISDPATTRIICGLAEMPYTCEARYYTGGLQTLSIISGRSELFRNVILSDYSSLIELVSLFDAYDRITGVLPRNKRIVEIINNRTTAWAAGLEGYTYASSFHAFPGLTNLERSSLARSLFNSSSTYLAYELTIPTLVEEPGPSLRVTYNNSLTTMRNTSEAYFDPDFRNYTITLSGSNQYMIEEIPNQWLLDIVESTQSSLLALNQSTSGGSLKIENVIPSESIFIRWTSSAIDGEIIWKLVQWQSGWNAGPYSSSSVGLLYFTCIMDMLKLSLGTGVVNGYSSVYRTDLSLPLNDQTRLFIRVNGTQNAKLAVAIDLTDGRRVFLFNSTLNSLFALQPQFQTILHQPELGNVTISGLQIFILSTDGSPCESFIKSFFATQP